MLSDLGSEHLEQILGSFNALPLNHRRQRVYPLAGFFWIIIARVL